MKRLPKRVGNYQILTFDNQIKVKQNVAILRKFKNFLFNGGMTLNFPNVLVWKGILLVSM